MALQVRQCATHAHKIIHQYINAPGLHWAVEFSLARQTPKTVGPRMEDNVGLNNSGFRRPPENLTQALCKDFRNCIDAFAFKCVCADQSWLVINCHKSQHQRTLHIESIQHQSGCSIVVARLGCKVGRMLLHRRLAGMNQHVGEIAPRCARRFDHF